MEQRRNGGVYDTILVFVFVLGILGITMRADVLYIKIFSKNLVLYSVRMHAYIISHNFALSI